MYFVISWEWHIVLCDYIISLFICTFWYLQSWQIVLCDYIICQHICTLWYLESWHILLCNYILSWHIVLCDNIISWHIYNLWYREVWNIDLSNWLACLRYSVFAYLTFICSFPFTRWLKAPVTLRDDSLARLIIGIKMADTCQNPSIQVRLSMIFPSILIRFAWKLKQISRKNESNMSVLSDFLTNIWLKSYWRATEIFGRSTIPF